MAKNNIKIEQNKLVLDEKKLIDDIITENNVKKLQKDMARASPKRTGKFKKLWLTLKKNKPNNLYEIGNELGYKTHFLEIGFTSRANRFIKGEGFIFKALQNFSKRTNKQIKSIDMSKYIKLK